MVSVTRLFVAALGLLAFSGAAFASQVTPDDRVKPELLSDTIRPPILPPLAAC